MRNVSQYFEIIEKAIEYSPAEATAPSVTISTYHAERGWRV